MCDLLYLENIQEYVEDCNIIVTYKWLSRKLGVPVNTAKRMLYSYLEQNSSVVATYFISGVKRGDTKDVKVCIVKKDELEAVREQFEQVWCLHVFSVQKAQLKDSASLFRSNYDASMDHLHSYSSWSTIDCVYKENGGRGGTPQNGPSRSSAKPTSVGKMTKTTVKTTPTTTPTAPNPVEGSSSPASQPPSRKLKTTPTTTPTALNPVEGSSSPASQPPSRKGSSVAPKKTATSKSDKKVTAAAKPKSNYFTKFKKKEEKVDDRREVSSVVASPLPEKRSSGSDRDVEDEGTGAAATDAELMEVDGPSQQNTQNSLKTEALKCSTNKLGKDQAEGAAKKPGGHKKKPLGSHQSLEFLNDGDVDDGESDEETPTQTTNRKAKTKRQQKKQRKASLDEEKPPARVSSAKSEVEVKKRKRVLELSSDEEAADEGNSILKENAPRRRKRIKKMVSKMYINDDGEMITEKVWESESTDASEEEVDVSRKSSQNTNTSSPPVVQAKKKQSSLFRFIKNS